MPTLSCTVMMKASLLQIEYHAEITFNMDIHQQNIRKCSCRSAKSRFGSYQYLSTVYTGTLLQKLSLTQGQNTRVTENSQRSVGKIRHQHRSDRSIYANVGIFRPQHVLLLRHVSFFNSVLYWRNSESIGEMISRQCRLHTHFNSHKDFLQPLYSSLTSIMFSPV
jgi:hypothetical protein